MMQFEFIIDFLYENFFIVLSVLIGITAVSAFLFVMIFTKKITTKVLELQTNSAILVKAKEDSDGEKIRYAGRIVIRETEPYIIKLGSFTYARLFVVRKGDEFTSDFPQRYISTINIEAIKRLVVEGIEHEEKPEKIANKILEIRQKSLADDDEKRDWNIIFESEAIKQGIAGLLASRKTQIITMLAGAFIGAMAVLILQWLGGLF